MEGRNFEVNLYDLFCVIMLKPLYISYSDETVLRKFDCTLKSNELRIGALGYKEFPQTEVLHVSIYCCDRFTLRPSHTEHRTRALFKYHFRA